ncbi:hypothetical protein NEOKW01_1345 [Nematocida sp. AWRm80]|nr:hypothetical protein NEOKW01_1345 [Nematocida sp. AWRm80]
MRKLILILAIIFYVGQTACGDLSPLVITRQTSKIFGKQSAITSTAYASEVRLMIKDPNQSSSTNQPLKIKDTMDTLKKKHSCIVTGLLEIDAVCMNLSDLRDIFSFVKCYTIQINQIINLIDDTDTSKPEKIALNAGQFCIVNLNQKVSELFQKNFLFSAVPDAAVTNNISDEVISTLKKRFHTFSITNADKNLVNLNIMNIYTPQVLDSMAVDSSIMNYDNDWIRKPETVINILSINEIYSIISSNTLDTLLLLVNRTQKELLFEPFTSLPVSIKKETIASLSKQTGTNPSLTSQRPNPLKVTADITINTVEQLNLQVEYLYAVLNAMSVTASDLILNVDADMDDEDETVDAQAIQQDQNRKIDEYNKTYHNAVKSVNIKIDTDGTPLTLHD